MFLTLRELIDVTTSAIKVVKHCGKLCDTFINSTVMQCSTDIIVKRVKDLEFFLEYEVLSISSYWNGVETVITVII